MRIRVSLLYTATLAAGSGFAHAGAWSGARE